MTPAGTNWAGNHSYGAARIERPTTVDEVCELVAREPRVRALGTRHSFSDIADTDGVLVALDALPMDVELDEAAGSVRLPGGIRYGDLARRLEGRGWALANLASLPHISVAGAVATGTHGSGTRNRSLSAAVRALDVVGPDGEVRRFTRGEADFDGAVVALGALGVVIRLELDVEPTYTVRQEVRTGLTWATVEQRLDEVSAAGYSVSLFTRFDDAEVAQLWVKSRVDEPAAEELFGTLPAEGVLHMLSDGDPAAVTQQGGVPGPWLDRLPHFRMEFTPSSGLELQSEFFVAASDGVAAIEALRRVAPSFVHILQVCEIRSVARDSLWLSGSHERDSLGLHVTWVRDEPAVRAAVRTIEDALAPFDPRPHWGKIFETDAARLASAFPRLRDFARLRDRLDPNRKFGNAFLSRVLGD